MVGVSKSSREVGRDLGGLLLALALALVLVLELFRVPSPVAGLDARSLSCFHSEPDKKSPPESFLSRLEAASNKLRSTDSWLLDDINPVALQHTLTLSS